MNPGFWFTFFTLGKVHSLKYAENLGSYFCDSKEIYVLRGECSQLTKLKSSNFTNRLWDLGETADG